MALLTTQNAVQKRIKEPICIRIEAMTKIRNKAKQLFHKVGRAITI